MAALQTSSLRSLPEVAAEAYSIGCGGGELAGIANIFGGHGLGVFLGRAVAGFAGLSLPAALWVRVYRVMRVPRESVGDILVARSARFGTRIRGRRRRGWSLAPRTPRDHHQKR